MKFSPLWTFWRRSAAFPAIFMMGKIIQALITAYKRDHEGVENVIVDVDEEKRDLKMYVQKEVVEEVENPGSQISSPTRARFPRATRSAAW